MRRYLNSKAKAKVLIDEVGNAIYQALLGHKKHHAQIVESLLQALRKPYGHGSPEGPPIHVVWPLSQNALPTP